MKWAKPNRSGANGGCFEVARNDDHTRVYLRDTKDGGTGPVLEFERSVWQDLIAAVQTGTWPTWVTVLDDGGVTVRMPDIAGPFLTFNAVEVDAFVRSVRDGQRELLGV